MTDVTTAEPSAEELAAANAVLARKAAADQAKADAALPGLQALIGDPGFAPVMTAVSNIRGTLTPGTPLHQHLTAILVGMTNLQADVARLAD